MSQKDYKAPVPQKPIRTVSKALVRPDAKHAVHVPSSSVATATAAAPVLPQRVSSHGSAAGVPVPAPPSPAGSYVSVAAVPGPADDDDGKSLSSPPPPSSVPKSAAAAADDDFDYGSDPADPAADSDSDQPGLDDRLRARIAELESAVDAERQYLANEYLSRHSERRNPANHKHFYGDYQSVVPGFPASGTEIANQLNIITAGVGVSNRLGSAVRLRHIHIRLKINVSPHVAFSTQQPVYPVITCILLREKICAIAGALPNMYASDTDPPSGQFNLMSRLGLPQSATTDRMAVLNPAAFNRYHVYLMRHYDLQYNTPGYCPFVQTGTWQQCIALPSTKMYNFKIPLDCITHYDPDGTNTFPFTNSLWFIMRSDYAGAANDTANGFRVSFDYTWDLSFDDVQT